MMRRFNLMALVLLTTLLMCGSAAWALSVTYNGNGNNSGSVPVDGTVYASGNTVTVPGNSNALVKSGYAFNGWNTAANGSGVSYAAGSTLTITADTTLYAKWAASVAAPAGLVSWWRGEGNATDTQGVNNGTLNGGVTFVTGKVGQAFSFDGSTAQYVSIPSSASLNIFGTHTVAFWVKPNALPTSGKNYQLVSKWTNGYEHKQVSINANGTVSYFLYGTTAGSGVTSTTALTPGVWCHVAATYDGANMKIYINGVQDASTAANGDVGDGSGTLYLGYNPDTAAFAGGEAYFNGQLD